VSEGKFQIYAGLANPSLSQRVADLLDRPLGRLEWRRFPDSETHVRIQDSVRGQDIYIIQSISAPANDNLMQLLILIDAFRRAAAARITAIIPYYGYSRQEKKSVGREPITARLVADLITAAGANRVVSIDLHAPAIQGFFNIEMDHLTAVPLLVETLTALHPVNPVIVAPDVGRAKFADHVRQMMNASLAIINKRRMDPEEVEATHVVGDVAGQTAIIVDDIISTGGTVLSAVRALIAAGARPGVLVAATHGVFAGPAPERLSDPNIAEVIVTDTIEPPLDQRPARLRIASVAPLLASAISRLHADESISALYPPKFRFQPV
jgi:ribose-phosphate pyrophosphokinase